MLTSKNDIYVPISLMCQRLFTTSLCAIALLLVSLPAKAEWNDFLVEIFGPGPGQETNQKPSLVSEGPFSSRLIVDTAVSVGTPNRAVLGTNIQWVQNGDGLLELNGDFNERKLKLINLLAPTLIRYPGGSHTDLFDWRNSVGPIENRKQNRAFFDNQLKPVRFGTPELLRLCREVGARPVISLNVITQSVGELEPWVDYLANHSPPEVAFWEIGNEPYLDPDEQPTLKVKPEQFAELANRAIRMIRGKVDGASIGVPMRSDKIGGVHATPFQGYNAKMLSALTEQVDFVAVHNTYLPFAYKKVPDDEALYYASAAAYRVVEEDFKQTREDLQQHYRKTQPKIAVTEYNNVFTFGKGATDEYLASYANAAYIFDLLVTFSQQPDLLFANHWSLLDNWFFGVIDREGDTRWAYPVLQAFGETLFGEMVNVTVEGPEFDSAAVGMVPSRQGTPLVRAFATVTDEGLQLFVINKHLNSPSVLEANINSNTTSELKSIRRLQANTPFDLSTDVQWQTLDPRSYEDTLDLPALSITWLSYSL
ncbi:MAG: hypothetical protein P1U54_09050 [Immundisolibacteraceae bacterium]|nr:hypothetical protein [Immundisolibacteraceae bacterium]